jgi:hypothetical protein
MNIWRSSLLTVTAGKFSPLCVVLHVGMVYIKIIYILNSGVIDNVSYGAVVTEHEVLSVYDFFSFFSKLSFHVDVTC